MLLGSLVPILPVFVYTQVNWTFDGVDMTLQIYTHSGPVQSSLLYKCVCYKFVRPHLVHLMLKLKWTPPCLEDMKCKEYRCHSYR